MGAEGGAGWIILAVVSLAQVVGLALACGLLIVVPGPSVQFVIGRALSHGRRTVLASVLGDIAGSRAKNSSNACATTADKVRPDAPACARTRAMSGTGSLTVNTPVGAGTGTCPDRSAR